MSLKTLRIACTSLLPRIKAGYPAANGKHFKGEPKDVTSDVLKAIIEFVGPGNVQSVEVDGAPKYEIEVREVKP